MKRSFPSNEPENHAEKRLRGAFILLDSLLEQCEGESRVATFSISEREIVYCIKDARDTDLFAAFRPWFENGIPFAHLNSVLPLASIRALPTFPRIYRFIDALIGSDCEVCTVEALVSDTLQRACVAGMLELIMHLVNREGASKSSETAMRLAAMNGRLAVIDYFLEHAGVHVGSRAGTAMAAATSRGRLDVIKHLHKKGYANGINSALHTAASLGYLGIVKYLVECMGADATSDNNCAVQLAATSRCLPVVEYLVQNAHADASADNNYMLYNAAAYNYVEMVKFLIERANVVCDHEPFYYAAARGHVDVVKYFLEETEAAQNEPHSGALLRVAAEHGRLDMVKFLVESHGADATTSNNEAMQRAAKNNHLRVVQYLAAHILECYMGVNTHDD